MEQPASDRLQEAQLLIGLLEYDSAEEQLRGVLRDADAAGDDESASLALEALGTVATRRGREAAARDLLVQAVERGGMPDPAERTQLYWDLARIHSGLGEADAAIDLLERALGRLGEVGDLAVRASLGVALSYACSDAGDYARTGVILADLVHRGAEDIDAHTRARINYALARLAAMTGRGANAIEYTRRAVESFRESGDEYSTANALLVHAYCLLDDGQAEEAARALVQSRRLFGPRPSAVDLGFQLVEEARYELQCGRWEAAQAKAREAIELLGDLSVPGSSGWPTWCWPEATTRSATTTGPTGRTPRRSSSCCVRTAGCGSWPRPTAGTASSCAAPAGPRRRWTRSRRLRPQPAGEAGRRRELTLTPRGTRRSARPRSRKPCLV